MALTINSFHLVLFDFQAQLWTEIAKGSFAFPSWSSDGQFVYLLHSPDNPAVLRIGISERKVERVADLQSIPITGHYGIWLGLAPDDSPLLLRDAGTQDIYALDWETP